MALILALEPDHRQATLLADLVRQEVQADLQIVDSRDAALAAISARVPDVLLLSSLLSPRDEEDLIKHLRLVEGTEHVQTHSIPIMSALGAPEPSSGGGFFSRLRRKPKQQDDFACAPTIYAEEIRSYIARAAEAKIEAAARPRSLTLTQERQVLENHEQPQGHRQNAADAFTWRPRFGADPAANETRDDAAVDQLRQGAEEATRQSAAAHQAPPPETRAAEQLPDAAALHERERLEDEREARRFAEDERLRRQREAEALERAARETEAAMARAREAEEAAERARAAEALAERAREEDRRRAEEEMRRLEEERRQLEIEAAAEREQLLREAEAAAEAAAERAREEERVRAEEERQRLEEERRQLEMEAAAERERLKREAEAAAERAREAEALAERAKEEERLRAEAERQRFDEERRRLEEERRQIEQQAAHERERLRMEAEEAAERALQAERLAAEQAAERERLEAERRQLAEEVEQRQREAQERERQQAQDRELELHQFAAATETREREFVAAAENRERQYVAASEAREREFAEAHQRQQDEERRLTAELAAERERFETERRRVEEEAAARELQPEPSRRSKRNGRRKGSQKTFTASVPPQEEQALTTDSDQPGRPPTPPQESIAAPNGDPFVDFRAVIVGARGDSVFRLMPITHWARAERPVQPQPPDDRDEVVAVLGRLRLPVQVSAVDYPQGCRIRRVRVPAQDEPLPNTSGPVIVSRRALEELRTEG